MHAGRVQGRLDFATRPDSFDELAARLKPRDQLVMEAGTYISADAYGDAQVERFSLS